MLKKVLLSKDFIIKEFEIFIVKLLENICRTLSNINLIKYIKNIQLLNSLYINY